MLRAGLLSIAVLVAACGDPIVERGDVHLVEVVDGDTVRIEASAGIETVRLVGLNTPERDECHHAEATAALQRIVASGDVSVERAGPDDRDRFGRALRYLYSQERLTNLEMVARGHGVALATDHLRAGDFTRASEAAWRERRGMWAPDACGEESMPPAIRISAIEANPPGDDALDPNRETVVLRNDSTDRLALAGWMLRDESSTNRFVFPETAVIAPSAEVIVRSGCGADSDAEFHWCAGPVWSNGGDTVILQTPRGTVVDRVLYRAGG